MEGAWAKLLHPLQLTGSGRPQLLPGEVECQLLDNVDLEAEGSDGAPPLKAGLVTLTTYRILWVNEISKKGGAIPLAAVCQIIPPKKGIKKMFATPRLRLQIWVTSEGTPALQGPKTATSSHTICLVIRGQVGPDSLIARLIELLRAKAWEAAQQENAKDAAESTGTNNAFTVALTSSSAGPSRLRPAMAGVSGILRKEQEQWEETDKNLQDAFLDLNALMSKAKEMVLLAEKMRAKLLAVPDGRSNAGDEDEMGSKQEMQDWLLSVGIASPVTKETAGALYHQQLSRQLADFVKMPLQKAGGMLSLVDVYCLFNRARGTELISPEDLLLACTIWGKIDVPVMLRRFDSGVMVIQSKSQRDEEVFARIATLVIKPEDTRVGISASDAARALGMAPALAKEQLLAAEDKGLLCRDDGPDGLRFFANFFKNVDVVSAFG